ncbi:MAG: 3-deoxy-7-phosphoheptulonate synthase [Desulfobacula sp.]|jgi:3-deoxy-7-phosphoheptulonate synthase|uniref:3-deoxy-7-phosphoheptulonate synthase n=1 Tax=Desulfobacula sp. TaxID=2593537 RepID=UPI001D940017|nr:3-deoxy-7-phosphoheptulonate synthase [Desulfobacula sp.]MBT3486053.1 3-deoxy-7-phosphoheptulonate synthase [Desulfobacula sp.]MBT3804990.1 3-deoxy-7-phosphoheptulonate synthase [Desulfobacula sp.]MBT4025478.1 3-deoxy-7-phosphoheptulonate synthase [Desulfobacula sp.]MBT4198748.1 3-deoxy-7-phosphoheptulonate synthase [Desulfobacula sp.]
MKQTYDVNVKAFKPLISPASIKNELPITDEVAKTVIDGRRDIENILHKKDDRLLVIAGPCSIHDIDAALEYAHRMKELRKEVKKKINLIMRVYFEKPRTTIGWKGLINDPFLDSTYDIDEGLKKARSLLIEINRMGLPTTTEILDPITPQYIAGLLTWVAIGARTTESQTHRELASGLSMPVGFKNSTDGSLSSAINAMMAAGTSQHFLGIDPQGYASIVSTKGNPFGHIVLRGGPHPNYDPVSVEKIQNKLKQKNLLDTIMIDCSHDNSGQKFKGQSFVFKSVLDQRIEGNTSIIGLMLESNLFEGSQKCNGDCKTLKYGVSITDECISWETTEGLIRCANERL